MSPQRPQHEPSALLEADRCVKCGLCLPTCPTYRLYADENESPRGRIALAEALLRGQIGANQQVTRHLDNCLLCRRCERACPSAVNYAALLDQARALLHPRSVASRTLRHTRLLRAGARLAGLMPGPIGALGRSLPTATPAPGPGLYPAQVPARGKVGLLLGCVTQINQTGALHAALRLLTELGYSVLVAQGQTCCGALAQHRGDLEEAKRLVAQNRLAFRGVDTVLGIASGCSLQLRDYGEAFGGMDIQQFLDQADGWEQLVFNPPGQTSVLHQPCTLVNGLAAGGCVERLLQRLPGPAPQPLGQPGECCGAAGEHLLTHRAQATRLRAPLIDELVRLQPQVLLSSNVGCAMHLAEGAAAHLPGLRVLHPVEWLVEHLATRID